MPFDNLPEIKVDPRIAIFDAAIERLETKGWCQTRLQDAEYRVCLMGAFGNNYGEVSYLIHKVLGRDPITWNDSLNPATGRDEVIALLKRVKSTLEKGLSP